MIVGRGFVKPSDAFSDEVATTSATMAIPRKSQCRAMKNLLFK